jgi:uncharacterized repeat protein (TIGR02543 family)
MKKLFFATFVIFGLLFAGCEPPVDATYKVLYYDNGSVYGFAPIDNNLYKSDMVATILDQGTLLKPGYEFSGWNTNSQGTGNLYKAGDTIKIKDRNILLYAQWTQ